MWYTVEMGSDGMIDIQSFMTTVHDIHVILRLLLQKFERFYVGTRNERDFIITALR
jgi:hypothetical protein